MKKKCVQCGNEFELTEKELQFYKSKGLSEPKRCKDCRQINKLKSESNLPDSASKYAVDVTSIRGNIDDSKPLRYKRFTTKQIIIAVAVLVLIALVAVISLVTGTNKGDKAALATSDAATNTTAVTTSQVALPESTGVYHVPPEATAQDVQAETTLPEAVVQDDDYYTFRYQSYLDEHFDKHGEETGCSSESEYVDKANAVIDNPSAQHKLEAEDNDDIYFVASTNEFVVVSYDGYLRTYFICSGQDYFDRQ